MTATELANYKAISTSLSYAVSGFPYTDYQYMPDKTTLANHGSMLYHSGGNVVWLVSRNVNTDSSCSDFSVRVMSPAGVASSSLYMCRVNSDGSTDTVKRGYGVPPVVSLRSEIIVTGGSGTEDDPYIISAQ